MSGRWVETYQCGVQVRPGREICSLRIAPGWFIGSEGSKVLPQLVHVLMRNLSHICSPCGSKSKVAVTGRAGQPRLIPTESTKGSDQQWPGMDIELGLWGWIQNFRVGRSSIGEVG